MMRLPVLDIHLPEWSERDFLKIRRAETEVAKIAKGAGQNSDAFVNACQRLLTRAMLKSKTGVSEVIRDTVDVRACTYLLTHSREFVENVSINQPLLDALVKPRYPMSKLSLMQMIRAFMEKFDDLTDRDSLDVWCAFIQNQLMHLDTSRNTSDLVRYAKFADLLFAADGPVRVVKHAQSQNIDLDGVIDRLGIGGFTTGRFIKLCRYQYYLETLDQIEVGEDHPVLAEVVKKEVAESPAAEGQLLGHAILSKLIDRSAGTLITQAWQNVILSIAGDPRVPKTSANYQQWWAFLGDQRVQLMRGWLSRFDLKLFLNVLEQSAKDGSIDQMERMFESRKVFMEGLLDAELITESRLFLSRHAEQYLIRYYDKKELPEYAKVSNGQTSMIYIKIANKVHMIEGSHSFKLKLLDRLPTDSRIDDYSVKKVTDDALRTRIIFRYNREFSGQENYEDLTHDVHLNWQHKAIQFLKKQGITVHPAQVVSSSRYRDYKRKFGSG